MYKERYTFDSLSNHLKVGPLQNFFKIRLTHIRGIRQTNAVKMQP